ncbi:MAG: hypothetical protein A2408_00810 [Candidatus Yonathbacteria bacterium RIFOXYC1_FULL_52_10]|uniref:Uncharacterized protein n=1 Tax=Candidatus Yonathbacteria bacterium RIFOXYD1_FULL_52_36 TaxID=1802730 RepID=A0A1G2SLG5_9BACT|nr:MAG: hypothetical protein A2408_00810 [Candidatus Yonathbacteria bacterium RIFOXYC1_FULL_52_10]OHA85221.1 MAG: hypothetical protein A2591_03955 [Candidatus Yonathbacteria bacterium RIFOXYD1_FULL_52_36]
MRVRISLMVLLGASVMVLPFLGFPQVVKTVLFAVLGFAIAAISYFSSIVYCVNCRQAIHVAERESHRRRVTDNLAPETSEHHEHASEHQPVVS